MPKFSEKKAVEDYIINSLEQKGWKFTPVTKLEKDQGEPLLISNLKKAIKRINPETDFQEEDLEKVIRKLQSPIAGLQGCKRILNYLKRGVPIKLKESNDLKIVELFDNSGEENEYIVSKQVIYKSAKGKIRTDVMLYVNGIPLVLIECKNPADPTKGWENGYDDVRNYERKVPELFKYVQFSIAAATSARYFPNVPWSKEEAYTYKWKSEGLDDLEATLEILEPKAVVDLVENFVFVREEGGQSTKIMPRYIQYRATNKIYRRVVDNLKGKTEKDSGLIWHWQGSGKSLTMIFAMHKLYHAKILKKPTILFVLDRISLEEQINDKISALDIDVEPEKISSIDELKDNLLHDEGRGKRGVFTVITQKFRPGEMEGLKKELRDFDDERVKTIFDRENIVALIDESHRTQYGVLASEMRGILQNAFFFAFTGTPIAKKERNTYRVFSYKDENYLDRYFIKESIEDGFTVPIRYQARLDGETYLEKEKLEAFFSQELEAFSEDEKNKLEKEVGERLNARNVLLKDPERIAKVAKDIADHFQENVDERFKAFVVATDRETCLMYKQELDKHLPKEYTEVVMSFGGKDPRYEKYANRVKEKYNAKSSRKVKEQITNKYKEEDYPKILIVTGMLLTGFDAPILGVMYLDKLMREHTLLQGVARTNRPFKDLKEVGLILDYVGIFDEYEKAVAMYSKEDIEGAVYSLDKTKEEFKTILGKLRELFKDIDKKVSREQLMRAIQFLTEENRGDYFMKNFRALRRKFELLGPDPLKAKMLDEFKWYAGLYYAYQRHIKKRDPDVVEKHARTYFQKTLDFVRKEIEIGEIEKDFPIITFDEAYLEELEEAYPDTSGKISDISTVFRTTIKPNENKNPIYGTISERIEKILEEWKERKASLSGEKMKKIEQEVYKDLKGAIGSLKDFRARQKRLRMNNLEFYLFLVLEKYDKGKTEQTAREIYKKIKEDIFPGFTQQPSALKKVKRKARGVLIEVYKKSPEDKFYKEIINLIKRIDEQDQSWGV